MPKNVISVQFPTGDNGYVTDIGENISMNTRFVAPPDLSDATINSIVTAMGGIRSTENSVCSDSSSGTPRKIEYIRANGNSMTLAIGDRTSLLATAATIRNLINGASDDNNQIVCIKLVGEEFRNLNDELSLTFNAAEFATSHVNATASKQNFVSGVISYNADAGSSFGAGVTQSIRSITEKTGNEFAAQLGATPATCIGDLLTIPNCGNGRRNPRKHRRFVLDFLISATESEKIELPVRSASAAEIKTCGTAAAALPGAFCIGYMGESYSRLHKLLNEAVVTQ